MDDDASEHIDSWHHHPVTQGILKKHEEKRQKALEDLVAATKASNDLRVFQFWAKYNQLDELCELLSGKGKKK